MDIVYFNSLMIGISLGAIVIAIFTLLIGLYYYGVRLRNELSEIRHSQLAFQSEIIQRIQEMTVRQPPSDNPGHTIASRRDLLLAKFKANALTRSEAVELNEILLKEKEAAEKRGDTAALIAIILGLALLAAFLAKSK